MGFMIKGIPLYDSQPIQPEWYTIKEQKNLNPLMPNLQTFPKAEISCTEEEGEKNTNKIDYPIRSRACIPMMTF